MVMMMMRREVTDGLRWSVRLLVFYENFRAIVQLFPFHSTILEPDFNLAFGEVQLARDLPALLASDVGIADELVLQNHRLIASVRLPLLPLPRLLI